MHITSDISQLCSLHLDPNRPSLRKVRLWLTICRGGIASGEESDILTTHIPHRCEIRLCGRERIVALPRHP